LPSSLLTPPVLDFFFLKPLSTTQNIAGPRGNLWARARFFPFLWPFVVPFLESSDKKQLLAQHLDPLPRPRGTAMFRGSVTAITPCKVFSFPPGPPPVRIVPGLSSLYFLKARYSNVLQGKVFSRVSPAAAETPNPSSICPFPRPLVVPKGFFPLSTPLAPLNTPVGFFLFQVELSRLLNGRHFPPPVSWATLFGVRR